MYSHYGGDLKCGEISFFTKTAYSLVDLLLADDKDLPPTIFSLFAHPATKRLVLSRLVVSKNFPEGVQSNHCAACVSSQSQAAGNTRSQ